MMNNGRGWSGQNGAEHAMLQQQQGQQGYHDDAPRPVVLLEDIALVIDVALIAAFCVAVQLLRRRAITIATFAHALSVPFLVVVFGHYIERHLGIVRVGDLVRRRPGRGGFTDWSSAGILSAAVVAALVARFWNCRGVGVDCVVGNAAPIHYRCKLVRLRFFTPVFAATMVFVYACTSARLNALLGGSVLHPEGGGYALAVLASPALVSALFVSGSVSVWLYSALVDAQGEGIDGLLGGGRECSLPRGKCAGRVGGGSSGGVSNAWEAGSSSSSGGSGRSKRGGGGGGSGSHSRGSSGVGGLSRRVAVGVKAAAKFAGDTAGPAHALDLPFSPPSQLKLRGNIKDTGRPSSSLIQAARGGLEVQRLDASEPLSDSVRGTAGSARWLPPPPGRSKGSRNDPSLAAAAPIGEGLLQAASESSGQAGDMYSYSSWGNVSSEEGPSYRRAGHGSAAASGASRLALGGVASGAREGAVTAAGMTLLPVQPAITPNVRNGFPDGGEAWQEEGEAGGTGPGPGRQQRRRRWGEQQQRWRLRGGGEGSEIKAMTASADGWTSSSSSGSSSSSDPGSSDEDFPGSGIGVGGGGGSGGGSRGGVRRRNGLSGNLSSTPSTRLSLGATSYTSSGVGGGGGGNRVPSFPSSGFLIDAGASPPGDGQSSRSFDRRGLQSPEVLPYFPVGGAPKSSTIASLTSSSSRSSRSGGSSSRRGSNVSGSGGASGSGSSSRGRDMEGWRGEGGDWGATFGNRWGLGEPSRENGATTTADYAAAAKGSAGGGGGGSGGRGGGGGGGAGDWGLAAFSGDLGTGAGEGATRLRRREGWIV